MVDDGQGVDISPLPNKRLISLLQQLFRSLKLDKSKAGIYLLPSGALPTLTRVGLFSGDEAGPALNSDDVYEGPELPSSVSQEAQAPLVDNGKSEFVQKGHVKDAPLGPTKPRYASALLLFCGCRVSSTLTGICQQLEFSLP